MKRFLFTPKGGLGPLYSSAFDSGSINTFVLVDGTPTYRITPIYHWNSSWLWFAIRSRRWSGIIPHFLVAKADRFGAPSAGECLAVWGTSLDSDTWTLFANQNIGASDIEFYHDSAFPGGMIYIAYLPLYPTSRVDRKVAEWAAADARIVDTRSSDDFVISSSTARTNRDGRTAPVLPFYAFGLTNANANTKNVLILAAGNHPSETSGNFQLEGAINWLLAGSPEAEFLLDWFNVLVYPCTNPQGRWVDGSGPALNLLLMIITVCGMWILWSASQRLGQR